MADASDGAQHACEGRTGRLLLYERVQIGREGRCGGAAGERVTAGCAAPGVGVKDMRDGPGGG